MIVCAKCGNANEARDEFCGSCGAFLEWHGERIAPEPEPEPEPVVEAPTERPRLIERVRYVVGLDDQIAGQQPPVIHSGGLSGPAVQPPPRENPVAMGPPIGGDALGAGAFGAATGGLSAGLGSTAMASPPSLLPPIAPPHAGAGTTAGGGTTAPPPPYVPPVAPPPRVPSFPPTPVDSRNAVPPNAPPPLRPDPGLDGRRPGPEFIRPDAHRPDATDLGPADLYCGSCGGGNAAGRRFCRRCGTSLAEAVPVRRSFWQRMFGGGGAAAAEQERRRRGELGAGDRPRQWRKLTIPEAEGGQGSAGGGGKRKFSFRMPRLNNRIPIGKSASVVLAIVGLIGFGVPAARQQIMAFGFDAFNSVKRVVQPEYAIVAAKSATATSTAKGKPALNAIDQDPDSYWAEALASTGAGAQLTIVFAEPTDIDRIGFYNGADQKNYTAQPRVKSVEVSYFDKEKTRTLKKTIPVGDTQKRQDTDLEGKEVASVTVKILEVFPGQKGSAAALREVVFWRAK